MTRLEDILKTMDEFYNIEVWPTECLLVVRCKNKSDPFPVEELAEAWRRYKGRYTYISQVWGPNNYIVFHFVQKPKRLTKFQSC